MAYWETFQNAYKRARDASDIDTEEEAQEAGGPIYSRDSPSITDSKHKKTKYAKKLLPFDPYIECVSSSEEEPAPPVHPGGPGPYDWPEDPPSPTILEELKAKRKAEKLRKRKEEERKKKRAAERRKSRLLKKYGPGGKVFDPNAAYVDFEDGLSDDDTEFEDRKEEEERRKNRRLEGRAKRAAERKRYRDFKKQMDMGNGPVGKSGDLDVGGDYYTPVEDSADEEEEAKKKRRAVRRRAVRTKKAQEEKENEKNKKRAECTGHAEKQGDTNGEEKCQVAPLSSTAAPGTGIEIGGSEGGGDSIPSSSHNGESGGSKEPSDDAGSSGDSIVSDFDNSEDEDYNSDDERHSTDSDYDEYQDDESASEDEGENEDDAEDDAKDDAGSGDGNGHGNGNNEESANDGSDNGKYNGKKENNNGDTEDSLSPTRSSDNEETTKRKKAARPAALARARAGKIPARRPVKPANPTGGAPDGEPSSSSSDDNDDDDEEEVGPDSDDFDDTSTSYPALVGDRQCGGPTKSGGLCKLKIRDSNGMPPHGCFHHRSFIPDVVLRAKAAAAAKSRVRRVDRARRRKRLALKRQKKFDDAQARNHAAMESANGVETAEGNPNVLLPDLDLRDQGYRGDHQPQGEGIYDDSRQSSKGCSNENGNNWNDGNGGGGWDDNSGSSGGNQSDWSDNGGEGSSGGQVFNDRSGLNNSLDAW